MTLYFSTVATDNGLRKKTTNPQYRRTFIWKKMNQVLKKKFQIDTLEKQQQNQIGHH
jgi:hypothetical protein